VITILRTVAVRGCKFATLGVLSYKQIKEKVLMLNTKFFEEMSSKLNDAVASGPAKDFEKNARALLAQGFAKLDLVSREEYEVLLLRLEKLEARVASLETKS
jgi:BMFP domain-containing protein YqiC